eukprot:764676-Hanusia_phi.AAC.2
MVLLWCPAVVDRSFSALRQTRPRPGRAPSPGESGTPGRQPGRRIGSDHDRMRPAPVIAGQRNSTGRSSNAGLSEKLRVIQVVRVTEHRQTQPALLEQADPATAQRDAPDSDCS